MTSDIPRFAPPVLLLALALALAACTGAEASEDVDPGTPRVTAEDLDDLPRRPILVGRIELRLDGGTGRLGLGGDLPTPCHLAMWAVRNGHERIDVEMWTVHEPDVVCSEVLQPFDIEVSLGEIEGTERVFLDGGEIGRLSS